MPGKIDQPKVGRFNLPSLHIPSSQEGFQNLRGRGMLRDQSVAGCAIHDEGIVQPSLDSPIEAALAILAQWGASGAKLFQQVTIGRALQSPAGFIETALGDLEGVLADDGNKVGDGRTRFPGERAKSRN